MIEETTVNGGYGGFHLSYGSTSSPLSASITESSINNFPVMASHYGGDISFNDVSISSAGDDGFMFPAVPFLEARTISGASGYGLLFELRCDHRQF